ncbi:MAG: internal scaffolding protein [Microvirus sp.]|nr:MAG: internal scaffolding protein [Microvirus sp.]
MSKSNIPVVFVRSPYNYDMMAISDLTGLSCGDESLTVQSEKDDADINVLLARFGVTGQMPQGFRTPSYGDFTAAADGFQAALHVVMEAEENFLKLDAKVRARFNNSPQELLDFVSKADNLDEAIKLGLVPERVPAPAAPAVVAVETPAKPA